MLIDFKGRTVVITGGGTGIGRAISIAFGSSGASVVVNYRRSRSKANETVAEIEKAGGRAVAVQADVTVSADVDTLIERSISRYGGLDIFINNAGGNLTKHPVSEYPEEIWDKTVALNLKSVYLCCKAVIPHLPDRTGRIIVITSISSHTGGGVGGAAYGAAKAGGVALVRSLAHELAPRGITVNGVAPGIVDTRMHTIHSDPESYTELLKRIPLGRFGTPEEVAGIVLLLASEAGSYITGENIHVNGGMIMV